VRDREDGLLVKPGDPEDLARAIASIVRGDIDCGRMREKARKRQAESFSDRSMAAGVAAVYREVLGKELEA
jgi:glycosyltransferase involved in cell wall biosynthesis